MHDKQNGKETLKLTLQLYSGSLRTGAPEVTISYYFSSRLHDMDKEVSTYEMDNLSVAIYPK